MLVAVRDIHMGSPFSIAVPAGESGEFEQWELDTVTGEMILVQEP